MAVALGLQDGTKPAWQAAERFGEVFSYLNPESARIANFLIDVRANRVLGALDCRFFETLNNEPRIKLEVSWSPDSRWLAEAQRWKWATGPCSLHRLNQDGQMVARIDLGAFAEGLVSQRLQRDKPKADPDALKGYAVIINDLDIANDGSLSAHISAYQPRGDGETVDLSVMAKAQLLENSQLSLNVVRSADREQGGSVQPPTAPKSKPEGNTDSEPDSEVRPQ